MNLYEIDRQIMMAFESAVDEETGEIIDMDAYAELDRLQIEFADKTEGILLWIKNLNAEAEALKKEKMAFANRQEKVESKAKSLRKYIAGVLNGAKFQTERVSVTWRKSESAEYVGDILDLPMGCIRVKDPEVDKTALKKMLKDGVEIAGAALIQKNNMQIK